MSYETLAFIGAGNMASSLISGLIADGYPPERIRVSDTQAAASRNLGDRYGVVVCASNQEAVNSASVVVLAVKPQVMRAVLEDLRDSFETSKPLLLSIAAGIACKSIQQWSGGLGAIVRRCRTHPLWSRVEPRVFMQLMPSASCSVRWQNRSCVLSGSRSGFKKKI